jgi:hypothetical protein
MILVMRGPSWNVIIAEAILDGVSQANSHYPNNSTAFRDDPSG